MLFVSLSTKCLFHVCVKKQHSHLKQITSSSKKLMFTVYNFVSRFIGVLAPFYLTFGEKLCQGKTHLIFQMMYTLFYTHINSLGGGRLSLSALLVYYICMVQNKANKFDSSVHEPDCFYSRTLMGGVIRISSTLWHIGYF